MRPSSLPTHRPKTHRATSAGGVGCALLGLLAALAGCGAPDGPKRPLGERVTIAPDPETQRVATNPIEVLYRPGPRERRYATDDGGALIRAQSEADRAGAWSDLVLVAGAPGATPVATRRARFARVSDGRVLLLDSLNIERDLLTVFEPPLVVAPGALAVGETHSSQTPLRLIARPDDPDRREDAGAGTARITTTRQPPERVRTADGREMEVERLDVALALDLGRSNVRRLARYGVSISEGVVIVETDESVVAFGLRVQHERRTARLKANE